jgi:hypothetical protein
MSKEGAATPRVLPVVRPVVCSTKPRNTGGYPGHDSSHHAHPRTALAARIAAALALGESSSNV